jgi:hypothetical protein
MPRIPLWLRAVWAPDWACWHVHRCLECGTRFADTDEPGSWTKNRSDEFPELCSRRCGRLGHDTNCRAWGPFCPSCAVRTEGELVRIRKMYED